MRFAEPPQPFLRKGSVGQNPTVDGAVIDLKAAFQVDLAQIPIPHWIAQVTGHRLDDPPDL
jgi:hypothetical protein